jgi:hypothetical protein
VHARIGAVAGQRGAGFAAGFGAGGLDVGDAAAGAWFHQAQRHGAFVGGDVDFVQVVLVVRGQAVEHQVGSEALHRHRRRASGRQAFVQVGQRGAVGHQQRVAVGKGVPGLHVARPLRVGQALFLGVETHQVELRAQEVAEPLRGQRPHVVGPHHVVPDPDAGRCLHGVQHQVQCEHAGRAQHYVAVAQRGLDERHARQFTLGEHLAVFVHHHPGAVEFDAGLHQQALRQCDAGAGLHRVQEQRADAAQQGGGGIGHGVSCRVGRA